MSTGTTRHHHYAFASAGEAATVVLAAPGAGKFWEILEVAFGYDQLTATAKELSIVFGATTIFKLPFSTEDGKQYVPASPIEVTENTAVTIELAADAAARGYLNVRARVRTGNR